VNDPTTPNRRDTMKVIEYEVRHIDEHGDSIDIDIFKSRSEALDEAKRRVADNKTVIVETRKNQITPDHNGGELEGIDYETIFTAGNADWLRAGGWTGGAA